MKIRALIASIGLAIFLVACGQKETVEFPNIPDLDLSVVQPVDYYRARIEGAKQLAAWCRTNLKPNTPYPTEGKYGALAHNCQNASFAEFSPKKSVKEGKTYKSYN